MCFAKRGDGTEVLEFAKEASDEIAEVLPNICIVMRMSEAHFALSGREFFIHMPVLVALCLIAIATAKKRFHLAFVSATLVYQLSWIWRLFDTIV